MLVLVYCIYYVHVYVGKWNIYYYSLQMDLGITPRELKHETCCVKLAEPFLVPLHSYTLYYYPMFKNKLYNSNTTYRQSTKPVHYCYCYYFIFFIKKNEKICVWFTGEKGTLCLKKFVYDTDIILRWLMLEIHFLNPKLFTNVMCWFRFVVYLLVWNESGCTRPCFKLCNIMS